MRDRLVAHFVCTKCQGRAFDVPKSLAPHDEIGCLRCGATFRYSTLREAAVDAARKLLFQKSRKPRHSSRLQD